MMHQTGKNEKTKNQEKLTVLWVDDDIHDRLESYLEEVEAEGHIVLKATSPDEMFSILDKNISKIDLIILDIMMPVGNGASLNVDNTEYGMKTGVRLLEWLVLNPGIQNNGVKMIVFTNRDDEEARYMGNEHGIPYLRKEDFLPFEFVDYIKKMR